MELCQIFEDTLCLTHDLMEDSVVPSNLYVNKVPPPPPHPYMTDSKYCLRVIKCFLDWLG